MPKRSRTAAASGCLLTAASRPAISTSIASISPAAATAHSSWKPNSDPACADVEIDPTSTKPPMLVEMAGRLAAVSKQPLAAAVRERFGIQFQIVPLGAELLLDLLLLAAEIGGVGIAMKLATGVGFQWWIVPIGIAIWTVLWRCGFGLIEYGIGLLGLVTLSFVVAAWRLGPNTHDLTRSLLPSLPQHDAVRYAFIAVSIVGATVSPYLLNFYSSGTVEEKMTEKELWVNRVTAYMGTGFGTVV